MKNANILWASLAALALAACNTAMEMEDPLVVSGGLKVLTVSASRSEETKTSYDGDQTFAWSVDDQVSILCNDGSVNNWETFTASEAAVKSPLTATVAAGTELGSLTGKKPALYPASAGHVYTTDGAITFHIPAERDFRASEGGHAETAIPMFGWGDADDAYAFANMTGAIKFTFSGITATHVKFTFTSAGEKLNGSFMLTGLDTGDAADVTWTAAAAGSDAEKTLTFYADVPADHKAIFYIPYPTGTLAAGSKVRLEDVDTDDVLFEHSSLGLISVVKNRITVLPQRILGYTESPDEIMNPERGFCSFGPITVSSDGTMTGGLNGLSENSLAFPLFYLGGKSDFVMGQALTDEVLASIRGVLTDLRDNGKKVILRFAYTSSESAVNRNPEKDEMINHISQLAPIFTEFEDVIYVVQAGFLGTYGEWWYNSHLPDFTFAKEPGGSENNTNLVVDDGGRGDLLNALLAAVPASRQVALRTPKYKLCILFRNRYNNWQPITDWDGTDANSRVSFHNDGFRSNMKTGSLDSATGTWPTEDNGTFDTAVDRQVWIQQSAYLAVGGEMATFEDITATAFTKLFGHTNKKGVYASYADAAHTIEAIHREHMSYLNGDPTNAILKHWVSEGRLEDIRKALGYRLWISDATVNHSGTTLSRVSFTLENSGGASVIYKRPMKLVLIHGDTVTELADLGDVRRVASGTNKTYTKNLSATVARGDKLAIWLPDNAASLQGIPAYAIRLANNETTFEGKGYNVFYTVE